MVVRRVYDGSDHFAVLAKVRIRTKWEFVRKRRKNVFKESVKKIMYSIMMTKIHIGGG